MNLGSYFDDAKRFTDTLFEQTKKGVKAYGKPLSEANLPIGEVLDHQAQEIADTWAYHQQIRRQVEQMRREIAVLQALNADRLKSEALAPEQGKPGRVRLRPMSEAPDDEEIALFWMTQSGVRAFVTRHWEDLDLHNIGWLPYVEFCGLFLTPDGEEVKP